jgi:hypothetical protein
MDATIARRNPQEFNSHCGCEEGQEDPSGRDGGRTTRKVTRGGRTGSLADMSGLVMTEVSTLGGS